MLFLITDCYSYARRIFISYCMSRDQGKGIGGVSNREGRSSEAIRTTELLRPSFGIDAILPATRIALVRHVQMHTRSHVKAGVSLLFHRFLG